MMPLGGVQGAQEGSQLVPPVTKVVTKVVNRGVVRGVAQGPVSIEAPPPPAPPPPPLSTARPARRPLSQHDLQLIRNGAVPLMMAQDPEGKSGPRPHPS